LAYQFRFLRWQKEQGIYHNRGLWNDQHEGPRIGQVIRFTRGLDFRGEPEERRVEPIRSIDPGPPAKPQEVVFRMSRKQPGIGWIVALPDSPQESEKEVRGRDEKQLFREQVLNQNEWEKFAVGSPELRALADREVPHWKHTTHVRGSSRVETIERREDGRQQRTHIISHDVREADGRIRTTGMVLTSEDLKALREVLEVREGQRRERTRPRGQSPPPGRTQEPGEPGPPRTAEEPVSSTTPLRERSTPEPSPAPPASAAPVRDNTHWIAGVWHGVEPPREGKWVNFEQGKGRVEERAMTPREGGIKAPGPGEPARYIVGQVIVRGVAKVHETTDDPRFAERRAEVLERRAEVMERSRDKKEQAKTRGPEPKPGLSMGI
jgi:hypothetical protein